MKAPTVGTILRSLRTAAGLTQQQLADAAGLHRDFVLRIEKGDREPGLDTARRLTKALGASLSVFDGAE